MQKLLQAEVPEVHVSDEEVAAYYREHPEEFELAGDSVTLRQILVPTLERGARRAPAPAQGARRPSRRSPAACPRARRRRAGGLMGTFARGQLPAGAGGGRLRSRPPATTSEIVESSLGYHVLRVEDRQAARAAGLAEAQARIRARLDPGEDGPRVREFVAGLMARAKVNHAAALSVPRSSS